MVNNNFYLTLMSNSSLNYYPENKTSAFTIHLPQKIQLLGEWTVALAELHYPYNFFNVTHGENNIYIEFGDNKFSEEEDLNNIDQEKNINHIEPVRCEKLTISPGFYKSIECVLKAINIELSGLTGCNILTINELNGRTQIHIDKCIENNIKLLTFSARLAMQLGFNPGDNILNFNYSTNIGNIYFGIPDQMLIYTDVIEPTFVGHEKAQIIKIVNTNGVSKLCKFGDVHSIEFQHMHYTPVLKKDFESISVDIRDCTGAFMPFRHGVSTIKLHFKKV